MTRLRRFLHLERARPEAPDAPAGPSSRARFGGADERPAASVRAEPVEARTPQPVEARTSQDRFRRPDLRAPDVAPQDPDAQPFVRCARCEADSSVYAVRCGTCGEPLDTPAQRAFNEELWGRRRREREEEERAIAAQRADRERAAAEAARARQEMGELLARETARREHDRLDAEAYRDGWGRSRWGWGDGWDGEDGRAPGLRLLLLIRDPRWRLGVGLAALALLLVLGVLAFRARSLSVVYVLVLVVALLFSPRRRRWWR